MQDTRPPSTRDETVWIDRWYMVPSNCLIDLLFAMSASKRVWKNNQTAIRLARQRSYDALNINVIVNHDRNRLHRK